MGRQKYSKNINSSSTPIVFTYNPEQRVKFLANLIIDKIFEDQNKKSVSIKNHLF